MRRVAAITGRHAIANVDRVADATKVIRDSQMVFVRFLVRWRHFADYNSRPHTIYYFDLQCKQIVCRVAINLIVYFESTSPVARHQEDSALMGSPRRQARWT